MSEYDQLLDKLLDTIEGAESEDALFALLSTLLVVIHHLDDPDLGFAQLAQTERIYHESFGTEPENVWVN